MTLKTSDPTPTPSSETPAPASQDKKPGSKWKRALAVVGITCATLLILLVSMFFYLISTEQGTRFAWQAASSLSAGHLSGTLESGKLSTGVTLRQVKWQSKNSYFYFDNLQGQWALSVKPWRLMVDFLHLGTIDLRLAGQKKSTKATLPEHLKLPISLEIRDLRIQKIRLHEGASATEFNGLVLQARSNRQQHEVNLERLETPFGATHATVKLNGVRPFPISGRIGLKARAQGEEALLDIRLSGSLADLLVALTATGKKLDGSAHIEVLPFSPVALRTATLKIEHLNPRAFAADAPEADLSLQAQLKPIQNQAPSQTPKQTQTATLPSSSVSSNQDEPLIVAGPLTITNQKPGTLDAHLLPLRDVQANVRLSEQEQSLKAVQIRLLKNLTLTGSGHFAKDQGQLDLKLDKLDLNVLHQALRPTQLGGSITLSVTPKLQQVVLKLNDPQLALGTQATLTAEAKKMTLNSVFQLKEGKATLASTLKKNMASSYQLDLSLERFNPLIFFNPSRLKGALPISPASTAKSKVQRLLSTSLSGTFSAQGKLAKSTLKATYVLRESEYAGLPLTGAGTLQLTKKRLLPSDAKLSIAGNRVAINGSFGRAEDRLIFQIEAPQLERLGFNLAGAAQANGDISGSLLHPRVKARYQARALAFGEYHLAAAQGQAELTDGANGALSLTTQAHDLSMPDLSLKELKLHLAGTRAKHTLSASALGHIHKAPLDLNMAAHGSLIDQGEQSAWNGCLTQFTSRGLPTAQLATPVAISVASKQIKIGAAHLEIEKAVLNLGEFFYDRGHLQSNGKLTNLDLNHLLQRSQLSRQIGAVRTDLVFDSDWDFVLAPNASGYLQLKRRAGDISLTQSQGGATAFGITRLDTRLDFANDRRAHWIAHAKAARLGTFDAAVQLPLIFTQGQLNLAEMLAGQAPLSGTLTAAVPSLKNTGSLFGPQIILQGQAKLNLAVAGQIGKPTFSGMLSGDDLALSLLKEGIALKEGVVRIALSDQALTFKQVEFHGSSGVLLASGGIQLNQTNSANPAISTKITARKLELFATPQQQLSISGQATIANTGGKLQEGVPNPDDDLITPLPKHQNNFGKLTINGDFTVDRAYLDLPATRPPRLGEDVKIVHTKHAAASLPNTTISGEAQAAKPAGQFLPNAKIHLDLGDHFRFHGVGADLKLKGKFTVNSVPEEAPRATGNVKVLEGSTYEAFGRKLKIEKGYFTFNGPIDNPGINILAMRRKQAVEAGVAVTGTLRSPQARLVSEPNVPDEDKLSWLLFGHGASSGTNLGQQNTMNAAFALLSNTGGKKIAQTIGFDEFSIGQSEAGLTDAQVVNVAKALNERFILGYEQGITATMNLLKLTWQISRSWSLAAHTGTLNGVDLIFQRRFNRLFKTSKSSKKMEDEE